MEFRDTQFWHRVNYQWLLIIIKVSWYSLPRNIPLIQLPRLEGMMLTKDQEVI